MTNREQLWCDIYVGISNQAYGTSSEATQASDSAINAYDKRFSSDTEQPLNPNTIALIDVLVEARSLVNRIHKDGTPDFGPLTKAVRAYDDNYS